MNAIAQTSQAPAATHRDDGRASSMSIDVRIHGGSAYIAISGRFDFKLWRNFKDAYTPLLNNDSIREIRVEMSRINYMDSSAMGMLLLLNERANAIKKTVKLLSTSGFVLQMLEVVNFGKIFNIEHIEPENDGSSGLSNNYG